MTPEIANRKSQIANAERPAWCAFCGERLFYTGDARRLPEVYVRVRTRDEHSEFYAHETCWTRQMNTLSVSAFPRFPDSSADIANRKSQIADSSAPSPGTAQPAAAPTAKRADMHFCAWCRRWFVLPRGHRLAYVEPPTGLDPATFSHGLCPECLERELAHAKAQRRDDDFPAAEVAQTDINPAGLQPSPGALLPGPAAAEFL